MQQGSDVQLQLSTLYWEIAGIYTYKALSDTVLMKISKFSDYLTYKFIF